MRSLLFGFALFALLCGPSNSQDVGERGPIAAEALRADLDLAYAALREGSPGLYRFTSKPRLDRAFASARARIDRPLTSLEFYRIMAPAVAAIRNGHTQLSASSDIWATIRQGRLLPLGVRVIDGRAFVLRDFSGSAPSLTGHEIVTINGRRMPDLLALMSRSTSLDGAIASARDRNNSGWGMIYNLPLIADIRPPYELGVRRSGEERRVTVEGLTRDQLVEAWRRFPADREADPRREAGLRFERDVAIITIPHWDYVEEGRRSMIDDIGDWFVEIARRSPRALIIDIRSNGGGDETVATALFAHLARRAFRHYECIAVKAADFGFLRYASDPQNHRDNLRNYTRPAQGRCRSPAPLELTNRPNIGLQQPRSPNYSGPVIVLTDGGSFSTSAEFAALVRSHRRGALVGEETSGSYYGSDSGLMIPVTLPNSRLELSVPLVAYWLDVRRDVAEDRGVVPDHRVRESIDDMIAGHDRAMAKAIRLAEASQRTSI